MDLGRFVLDGQATPWVSVSLERTGPRNLHAGLVYRDASNKLQRLHFGWHRRLYAVPYGKVACAIPAMDEAEAMWISGFCSRIAKSVKNKTIPYNLKYDADVSFNQDTGEIQLGANSTGLGCGTFVVVVFRSAGTQLVDVTDWPPPTAEDIEVQSDLVNRLLNDKDADRQAQGRAIQGEVGTKRIRPDHVAGACLEDVYPVRHETCFPNGAEVVKILDAPPAI